MLVDARMSVRRVLLASTAIACLAFACAPSKSHGSVFHPPAAASEPPAESDAVQSPAWRPTSTQITLSSFGFWNGSFGYEKKRADLTREQLTALEGLRTRPPPKGSLGADYVSYEVKIADANGSTTAYRAVQDNVLDSDESREALTYATLDYETLQPFLDTIHCFSAKGAGQPKARSTDSPSSPTAEDIASAPALPTDLGCLNGVFLPAECSDSFFTFDVAKPATYAFIGGRCFENQSLRLFSADGATLLAESAVTPDTCFRLEHPLDTGRYVLELSKTNATGCGKSAEGGVGDALLRVEEVHVDAGP